MGQRGHERDTGSKQRGRENHENPNPGKKRAGTMAGELRREE
jgi:hypothetical protein